MNIAFIGTLPPHPGGSAIVSAELLPRLSLMGHAVFGVSGVPDAVRNAAEAYDAAHPDIDVRHYPLPSFATAPNEGIPADFRDIEVAGMREAFADICADRHPDVILVGRETLFWTVPDLAVEMDVPTLVVAHGGVVAGLVRGEWDDCDTEALLRECNRADAIVSVAHHLAEPMIAIGYREPVVIPNGVDLGRFAPGPRPKPLAAELDIADDQIVCAHISNMKSIKRPLDVVEAAHRVAAQLPNVVFAIIGCGNMLDELKARVRDYGLEARFRFSGWVEHARVHEYLRLCDMVLLPSESEGLALVALETLATGRVLIASDVPATGELMGDTDCVVTFPVGDLDALSQAIIAVVSDTDMRRRIGLSARERVKRFSLDDTVNAYDALIRDLVEKRRQVSR